MSLRFWRLAMSLLAALSLGLSFCHVMELPARLAWTPRLWLDATVFGGLYGAFGTVGAVIDVAAILLAVLVVVLLRRGHEPARLTSIGALLLIAALATWFAIVQPMNGVMAGWTPGEIPTDFVAVRDRWEAGHVAAAAIKFVALTVLLLSVLTPAPSLSLPVSRPSAS